MKHKTRSIPSTKPENSSQTEESVKNLTIKHQNTLRKMIAYIEDIFKIRLHLYKRDINKIYLLDTHFFHDVLQVTSEEQLWEEVQGSSSQPDSQLHELQIIALFTKIVINLTHLKNECAQRQSINMFLEYKATIQWLEEKIVGLERYIRQRVKEKTLKQRDKMTIQTERQFKTYREQLKDNLQNQKTEFCKRLQEKHEREEKQMQIDVKDKVAEGIHTFLPSLKRREIRQQNILIKLAPFKSDKKRQYECSTLEASLNNKVENDVNRLQASILHYNQIQKQKLKSKQEQEFDAQIQRFEEHGRERFMSLQRQRQRQEKSQKIKINKLLEQNNKVCSERVHHLRNSFQAYSMRDQSRQIKAIMRDHRESLQSIYNAEDLNLASKHSSRFFTPAYSTLQVQSPQQTRRLKNQRYEDIKQENKILRRISQRKVQSQLQKHYQEERNMLSPKKSLVNLYDNQLRSRESTKV